MFEFYTLAIAVLVVGGVLWGAYGRNDTFHPLVYLMPMAGYLYVVSPILLPEGELLWHFTDDELTLVQGFNLACVVALALGVLVGDRGLRRNPQRQSLFSSRITVRKQLWIRRIAITLGVSGVLIFVYGLINVGGFVAAFDSPKGGGFATTGWLRDLKLLVVPAIGLLYMSQRGRPWTPATWAWLGLFSVPLLARSLLATSRGWAFMGAVALGAGWYLVQNRRPRLPTLLAGGAALGVFMLVLVSIRGQVYIGSDFFSGERPSVATIVEQALQRPASGGYGNEFVYGGYTILLAKEENDYYWGRRYLAYTFIRPIPSLIWPSKYRDVGAGGIRRNAGTLGEEHTGGVYERIAGGLYPGLAGDLYVEFSWGAVFAAFFFGWMYGVGWRWLLVYGGVWTIVYLGLLAFSVFAMMQTIPAAFVARFLLTTVPTLLLWRQWVSPTRPVQTPRPAPSARS